MNVSFASTDPLNSSVLDSATGQLLFTIETPPGNERQTTTTIFNIEGQTVGVFARDGRLAHCSVSVGGKTMGVREWLPKVSCRSSSRTFTASDGIKYTWRHGRAGSRCSQLIGGGTHQIAAEARLDPTTRQLTLDVGPTLLPFLDQIVLLFLVCEEEWKNSNILTAEDERRIIKVLADATWPGQASGIYSVDPLDFEHP